MTRRINGSSGKARKNSNGRDLFPSFTIIRNNCLERWEKREIEIETGIEREKESGRSHRAISRRVYYVETAGRDVAKRGDSVMHRNALAGTRERYLCASNQSVLSRRHTGQFRGQ